MKVLKIDFNDLPKSYTPILTYCRKLVKEGVNPDTRLECYRKESLDLIIHNIGLAAKLSVSKEPKPKFIWYDVNNVLDGF